MESMPWLVHRQPYVSSRLGRQRRVFWRDSPHGHIFRDVNGPGWPLPARGAIRLWE